MFLSSAIHQFRDYKRLADKTFAQLNDLEMLFEPAEGVNNIAIIIVHMHGNMLSRWTNFLVEDGEKEWRDRDREFDAQHAGKEALLKLWEEGWATLFNTLESLTEEDLDKTIHIRTKPLFVYEAIHRQLTHYASHVGQIILLGKISRGAAWESLSIPKGGSDQYNKMLSGKS